jgi:hypothetical protein
MLGHFGFSYIGLIFLLMLIAPNFLWARRKPEDYDPTDENKILLLFERAGQVLCTATILLFSDYNPQTLNAWAIWLFASVLLMLLYEMYWVRYFKSRQTVRDFYRPFLGVPVPGATFPVAAFLLLGVYGKVIWLVVSAVIFGIGHIGIHLLHMKKL